MKSCLIIIFVIFIFCPDLSAEELSNDKNLFIQTERNIKKDVLLPEKFLTDKIYGKRMYYSDDKDTFLAYIFLLKNFTGNKDGSIETNYKDLKEYLYPDLTAKKAHDKIIKILNILYKNYELIEFDHNLKENPEIKLLSFKENHSPYNYPSIDYLVIPEAFWSFGWEKRLSFTGLYVYLINLMEIKLVPFDTHWMIDPDILALKYNLSLRQIQQGLDELQQYSLLETLTTGERNVFDNKPVIKYKILPLYPWDKIELHWKNIETNNKNKDIKRASKYAGLLYKRYDPYTVEEILKLMKQFPPDKIKKAFNILDEKPAASKERSLNYLRKVLNNI